VRRILLQTRRTHNIGAYTGNGRVRGRKYRPKENEHQGMQSLERKTIKGFSRINLVMLRH